MRRLVLSVLLVVFSCAAAAALRAEEPKKIRVLLTYGGHGFEEKPFFKVFDDLAKFECGGACYAVTYAKAEMPKDAGLFKPGLEKQYDVLVMYDMVNNIKPEEQEAFRANFKALLKQGIGVVSLHHNMGAHSTWDEFRKIIGGKFILKKCVIDGKEYNTSGWKHDEHMKIQVVDKAHPITQGISDFEILDETYKGYYVAPSVHVLLKTDHPNNTPELAWTTNYGKSRVFYLMLGHDHHGYENPNFVKLVRQGIVWAAGK